LEKEKTKSKKEEVTVEAEKEEVDVESELKRLEQEVKAESLKRETESSTRQREVLTKEKTQLSGETVFQWPEWVDFPWMKKKPSRAEDLDSWLRDWCDLVLKWCQFSSHHVVGLKDFKTSRYFDELPEMELREILQHLVDRGLAKWIDKDKTVARIMWRSFEEWANDIHQWAFNNGVENLDTFVIRSANKDFSTLPIPDLKSIMEIMVKKRMLKWIDRKHEQAKLLYE
jgi:hypothetical protein